MPISFPIGSIHPISPEYPYPIGPGISEPHHQPNTNNLYDCKPDKSGLESWVSPFPDYYLMDDELAYWGQGETWEDEGIDFCANFGAECTHGLGWHETVEGASEEVSQYHQYNVNILIAYKDTSSTTAKQTQIKYSHNGFKPNPVKNNTPENSSERIWNASETSCQGNEAIIVQYDLAVFFVVVGDEDSVEGGCVDC